MVRKGSAEEVTFQSRSDGWEKLTHVKSRRKHILGIENSKCKSLKWEKNLAFRRTERNLVTWAKLNGAGVGTPSVVEGVSSKECILTCNRKPLKGLGRAVIRSNRRSLFALWGRRLGSSMETEGGQTFALIHLLNFTICIRQGSTF